MYSSIEECKLNEYIKVNTNPRYSHFCQSLFTAGDEEQFEQARNRCNPKPFKEEYNNESSIYWEGYSNIYAGCITNTFKYIFHKFKKGIFIQIRDNKLSVFLPFSKHNYTNEWYMHINKRQHLDEFLKDVYRKDKRVYKSKYVNQNKSHLNW